MFVPWTWHIQVSNFKEIRYFSLSMWEDSLESLCDREVAHMSSERQVSNFVSSFESITFARKQFLPFLLHFDFAYFLRTMGYKSECKISHNL